MNHTTYCSTQLIVNTTFRNATFSIVTKIFTTQRLTRGKSALLLFDILGGIHSKLENYGFHKQTLNTLDFKSNETINKAKRNVSMSDINV